MKQSPGRILASLSLSLSLSLLIRKFTAIAGWFSVVGARRAVPLLMIALTACGGGGGSSTASSSSGSSTTSSGGTDGSTDTSSGGDTTTVPSSLAIPTTPPDVNQRDGENQIRIPYTGTDMNPVVTITLPTGWGKDGDTSKGSMTITNGGVHVVDANGNVVSRESSTLRVETDETAQVAGGVPSTPRVASTLGVGSVQLNAGETLYLFINVTIDSVNIYNGSYLAEMVIVVNGISYPMTIVANVQNNPEPVRGCMDQSASNYNSSATVDDGSCTYPAAPVYGCTDPMAINYNPNATVNDGSCAYGN